MKLVIIIPCFNEEKTLPLVLQSIPTKIKGIRTIEKVVIDDGSTDKTVKVAIKYGVKHFVIHRRTKGLARSFSDGIQEALKLGADIIVNTDGDNQLPQEDIPKLIKPILDDKADMVIGDRQTQHIKYFPLHKKLLQKIGSKIVSLIAGMQLPDAVSGFRAYSRATAMRLNNFTDFSYTIETLIQAGIRKKRIATVKIKTREAQRESRLIKNLWNYLLNSGSTVLRVFAIYQPFKVFFIIGFITALPGIFLLIRYIILEFFLSDRGAHIQSLLAAAVFILLGFQIFILGIIADLISINRTLEEEILFHLKQLKYKDSNSFPHKRESRIKLQIQNHKYIQNKLYSQK